MKVLGDNGIPVSLIPFLRQGKDPVLERLLPNEGTTFIKKVAASLTNSFFVISHNVFFFQFFIEKEQFLTKNKLILCQTQTY